MPKYATFFSVTVLPVMYLAIGYLCFIRSFRLCFLVIGFLLRFVSMKHPHVLTADRGQHSDLLSIFPLRFLVMVFGDLFSLKVRFVSIYCLPVQFTVNYSHALTADRGQHGMDFFNHCDGVFYLNRNIPNSKQCETLILPTSWLGFVVFPIHIHFCFRWYMQAVTKKQQTKIQ